MVTFFRETVVQTHGKTPHDPTLQADPRSWPDGSPPHARRLRDSEDRAARHLENAEALVAKGDTAAAVLEFRNVLEYQPTHREALTQLAAIQMSGGAEDAAFGTYQRLVDDHPDAAEAWLSLSEIAIRRNRWDEAVRFAEQAEALAPDSDRTALIRAALDFRAAIGAEDAVAAAAAAAVARRHVEGEPDNLIARQVLIADAGNFSRLRRRAGRG